MVMLPRIRIAQGKVARIFETFDSKILLSFVSTSVRPFHDNVDFIYCICVCRFRLKGENWTNERGHKK